MNRTWKHDDIFGYQRGRSSVEEQGYGESWWATPMTREEFSSRAKDELPRMRVLAYRAVIIAKDTSA